MIIPIIQVTQRILLDKPLWYFDKSNEGGDLQVMFDKLKEATGYRFDNDHTVWSDIYGNLRAISIHGASHKKTWVIQIWDEKGQTSILGLTQPMIDRDTDVMTRDNYDKLSSASEKFMRGKVACSACSKETDSVGNGRRFYAGIYCEACWENTYKKQAASENYN